MRCLLDMDGVIADFVGGFCRQFGFANPYHDGYRGPGEITEALGIDKDHYFALLDESFWANLEPTREFAHIMGLLEGRFGKDNICLLTSPVRTHGCFEGKLRWIRQHLPDYSRRFLVGPVKHFCASPDSVLLDDHDRNCDDFRRYGGLALQVARPWNRLRDYSCTPLFWLEHYLSLNDDAAL